MDGSEDAPTPRHPRGATRSLEATLKQRLLSGGAWALGGRVVTVVAALITNALLARLLSPQEFGSYFLAVSIIVFGATVGSLGLHLTVVRFVAESMGMNQPGRARRMLTTILKLGTFGALLMGVLYLAFGGVLAEKVFHSPALAAVSGLVAGWMVIMTLQSLLAESFRGFHDIRLATAFGGMFTGGMFTAVLLSACLALLWLVKGQGSLPVVMLLALASGLASALLASWLLYRKASILPREKAKGEAEFGELLSVSWPLLVTSLTFLTLTQADLWILGAFRPQQDLALYGSALRLVLLVAMPIQIVHFIVPPLIAEMYAQGRKRELERTLRATATLAGIPAFLMMAVFILFGSQVLGLVFGEYYTGAALVLMLLSFGQLATVWAGSAGILLNMTGHQLASMIITAISGIFVIATGLLVVRDFGITGVAATFALGLITQNILLALYGRRIVGVRTYIVIWPGKYLRGLLRWRS